MKGRKVKYRDKVLLAEDSDPKSVQPDILSK